MAANLQAHGIKLAFGETVQEITGNGKVEKLITDKASYKVDMVILAVGFKPNTSLSNGSVELYKNGAFLVDKKQETSVSGVYAIGDCATVYNNASQEVDYIALASMRRKVLSLLTVLVDIVLKVLVYKAQMESQFMVLILFLQD